jgi:hypothetical protein
MKVVAFVLPLLIMMTAESSAQSRPPDSPPSAPPAMQHPTADQHGTEQSPLVVKIAPATKSEAEVTEERRERDEKSANDRETILFNG